MSANSNDNSKDDANPYNIQYQHSSGMTPSIITTINNTSPTLLANNNNINNTGTLKNKRTAEPFYESYIEDSFVGHWEREDDDPHCEYREDLDGDYENGTEGVDSALHPSTIEFDFDSFGPESFIYTPAPTKQPDQVEKNDDKQATVEVNYLEKVNQVQSNQSNDIVPSRAQSEIIPSPLDSIIDNAQIDYKVIEPYKKVISHAGYCHHSDSSAPSHNPGEPAPAIIVFSACYLPDRSRRDYNYVMDHLFLYVLSSLHELIADDYILIYLHNTHPSTAGAISSKTSSSSNLANGSSSATVIDDNQNQNNLPTFTWIKRCYQMIDRKLRKNLKILYLVKPTFWLKTIVIMCKPFISSKFSKKLRFVDNMDNLKKCLPVDKLTLPASAESI